MNDLSKIMFDIKSHSLIGDAKNKILLNYSSRVLSVRLILSIFEKIWYSPI